MDKKRVLSLLFGSRGAEWAHDVTLFIGRGVFGLSMSFGHGINKVPPSEKFIASIGELGFPFPFFFAWAAGLAEFLGGLLIALGLTTRASSFFLVITMFVAVFLRHADDPFASKEKSLMYLVVFVWFMLVGAGRFSVDRLLGNRT